ncbi:phosphotransferase [Microbacterium sp. NPDC076911]|uniref:phosphotransferase n=1 Tax=Microbacterium sp. NPDC076911 TaxID=3154958 RepID=UPI00341699DB
MARSPLTLAASVTSALPLAGVVRVGALTEGEGARFDSAIAELDDGRSVVIRVPNDDSAAVQLSAEVAALRALTAGVRSLLPFRAPEVLGETTLGGARAVVVDYLPGYRVDAAELPPGRGISTSLGEALAALHALPVSIVRAEGLPVRLPQQVRTDVSRLLDRAETTGRVPDGLVARWRRAAVSESVWRFESAVVIGSGGAASFIFDDVDDVPQVTGLLDWHGLAVGDPAADLHWLASAPDAAEDIFAAYVAGSDRAPDALFRARTRLYAELEFAKWLVHGYDTGSDEIMSDAQSLLEALDASTTGDEIVPNISANVDGTLAFLDDIPSSQAGVDTSMQTDAYDAEELAQWVAREAGPPSPADDSDDSLGVRDDSELSDHSATAPIDVDEMLREHRASLEATDDPAVSPERQATDTAPAEASAVEPENDDAHAAEAERASDAALRRWLSE